MTQPEIDLYLMTFAKAMDHHHCAYVASREAQEAVNEYARFFRGPSLRERFAAWRSVRIARKAHRDWQVANGQG